MMSTSWLESVGVLLSVLTPLVAVPLTVITFYLRSLREQQQTIHSGLIRRVESMESAAADLRKGMADLKRDYTTKEEWLRECMLARRTLDQLSETTVRLETTLQGMEPVTYPTSRPGEVKSDHVPAGCFGVTRPSRCDGGSQ